MMRILLTAMLALTPIAVEANTLVRVIDGDTIDVDHIRYRLHGIDAPEVGQNCQAASGGEWRCGQAALRKMEELVLDRDVRCEGKGKDLYGRVIAICLADGREVNAAMVLSGMAWAFRKYSADYIPLEDAAKEDHVGIWQAPTGTAWDFRAHKWIASGSDAPNAGCPIKGNINRRQEKIYHTPWSKDYVKTKIDVRHGERWFCSEDEAISAGWRAPAWGY